MTEAWARTRESSTQHRILDQPFARRARTFFSFLNLLDEDVDEDIEQLEHRNIYKEIKITIIRESKKIIACLQSRFSIRKLSLQRCSCNKSFAILDPRIVKTTRQRESERASTRQIDRRSHTTERLSRHTSPSNSESHTNVDVFDIELSPLRPELGAASAQSP